MLKKKLPNRFVKMISNSIDKISFSKGYWYQILTFSLLGSGKTMKIAKFDIQHPVGNAHMSKKSVKGFRFKR